MYETDTIVAPATATGKGAIGIIRLSGEEAWKMVSSKIPIDKCKPRTIYHSKFISSSGDILDDIAFILYKSPSSYTGEDMVELFFHGGMVIMASALEELINQGARIAEPGEFTRRAFLKGKIDLVTAESIERLIDAPSKASLTATTRLMGAIKECINTSITDLERMRTELVAEMEFPEDIDLTVNHSMLNTVLMTLKKILRRTENSSPLENIPMVVLTGKPNSGKSSIFNCILREERAIVHHKAGTTRDFIEATFVHNGIAMRLVDTAGIDHPESSIDKIAMDRAKQLLKNAPVKVWVRDSTLPRVEEPNPDFLNVLNKIDLSAIPVLEGYISVSAKTGDGIHHLLDAVSRKLMPIDTDHLNMSQRAKDRLRISVEALENSAKALSEELYDIGLVELERGLSELYLLTGRQYNSNVLDEIFQQFCIGK